LQRKRLRKCHSKEQKAGRRDPCRNGAAFRRSRVGVTLPIRARKILQDEEFSADVGSTTSKSCSQHINAAARAAKPPRRNRRHAHDCVARFSPQIQKLAMNGPRTYSNITTRRKNLVTPR
jgi:hypothetical protein